MKILHLNSNYSTSTLYKNLYSSLESKGIEQIIYIPIDKKFNLFKKELKVEDDTLSKKHIQIKCYNKIQNILFIPKIYIMYKNLIKNINIKDISLVHAHSTFSNGLVAYFLKKFHKKKYIVAFRSTDLEAFDKVFIFRFIIKKIMNNSERVIFINHSYKNRIIDKYFIDLKNKVEVIPNGVEKYWIDNQYIREKKQTKQLKILTIAYFIPRKNFDYTIKIYNELCKKYDCKLTIVGEGPLKNILKKEADKNSNITLLSWQKKEAILKLMRENDLFILPSKRETFGLIYIEALSQGMKIVYTKNDGVDGFIDSKMGVGCDFNFQKDIEEIEELIKRDYFSERNILNFAWKNIADKYKDIYATII